MTTRLPRPWRALARAAAAQGWTVRVCGSGHLAWYAPDGAIVVSAASPSDHRARRNHEARLRRAGLRQRP